MHLLTYGQSTHAAASQIVLSSLADTAESDVVVISFDGHESADGQLVFHDTDAANLNDTALSMALLAEAFKSTKARAILCILYCCFSGHAPARVLEADANLFKNIKLSDD